MLVLGGEKRPMYTENGGVDQRHGMNSGKEQQYGHTRNRSATVHRVLSHFID